MPIRLLSVLLVCAAVLVFPKVRIMSNSNFNRVTMTSDGGSADNPLGATVRAAQQGDRQAFGQLAERYQRAVYSTVYRRLHNHAEAQEVCQDVLIQAMRKIGQLQDTRCFGSWLRSIAGRMAINRALRRKAMTTIDFRQCENGCADVDTPLRTMIARERREQVRSGMRKLRALDRQTLTAFYLEGSSLVEMSRQFASPIGTIKRRLHVARKRLARELESIGVG
jgi:RNA polymerase sigma-70 factor, ECF subfamily